MGGPEAEKQLGGMGGGDGQREAALHPGLAFLCYSL